MKMLVFGHGYSAGTLTPLLRARGWHVTGTTRDDPDRVAAAGAEPLRHWMGWGWREGRDAGPLFDARGYLEAYPDVAAAGLNPLTHFLQHGAREGRDPTPDLFG